MIQFYRNGALMHLVYAPDDRYASVGPYRWMGAAIFGAPIYVPDEDGQIIADFHHIDITTEDIRRAHRVIGWDALQRLLTDRHAKARDHLDAIKTRFEAADLPLPPLPEEATDQRYSRMVGIIAGFGPLGVKDKKEIRELLAKGGYYSTRRIWDEMRKAEWSLRNDYSRPGMLPGDVATLPPYPRPEHFTLPRSIGWQDRVSSWAYETRRKIAEAIAFVEAEQAKLWDEIY